MPHRKHPKTARAAIRKPRASMPYRLATLITGASLIALSGGAAHATTINDGQMTSTFGSAAVTQNLLNNGAITVYGNGMTGGNASTLENSGAITVTGARAYGMTASGGSTLKNDPGGTITISQSYSYGMAVTGDGGAITNSGTITGNGRSDVGIAASGSGITVTNTRSGILNMQGSYNGGIVVNGAGSSAANAGKILVGGTGGKGADIFGTNASFTNTGAITVTGATGTAIEGGNQTDITNAGTITVTATDGTGVMLETGATLANTGSIATTQDYSYTVLGYGDAITVTNSGNITTAGAQSAAIALSGDNDNITNSGVIATTGQAAYGISVSGTGGTVTNTGTIITSGENAHGILITGNDIAIASTGNISATGTGSHELAIGSADGSATGSARLTAWTLTLAPNRWTNPDSRPIAIGPGSTLTFADTRLILRPGNADSGFAYNRRYAIGDMLDNNGAVTGNIGSDTPAPDIVGAMPMLKAMLYGSGESGVENQQVALTINPQDSHGQAANSATVHRTTARLWLLDRTLGNALDALADASDWAYFAQPYYQHSRVTGSAASRTDSGGLILGATRQLNTALRLGWHAGIEHSDLTAGKHGLKSDIDAWTAGLHGRYNLTPGWRLQGQLTGTASRSDYRFSMEGDSAKDKRTEYGLFAGIKNIIDIPLNAHHTLTPEIGLAWAWMRNPAMDADWQNTVNRDMNIHFEKRDYTALYGSAALRYTGTFQHEGNTIRPTLALGIRQNLTDGHIDSGLTFMNEHYRASLTEDRTAATIDAGIRVTRGTLTGTLRYNGDIGNHFTDHIIWAEIGSAF